MDSLSSVLPSIVLPPANPLHHYHHHRWRSTTISLLSLPSLTFPAPPNLVRGDSERSLADPPPERTRMEMEMVAETKMGERRWRELFDWTGLFLGCRMSSWSESLRKLMICVDTSNRLLIAAVMMVIFAFNFW